MIEELHMTQNVTGDNEAVIKTAQNATNGHKWHIITATAINITCVEMLFTTGKDFEMLKKLKFLKMLKNKKMWEK